MVNNKFFRLEPAAGVDAAAIIGEPILVVPLERVTQVRRNDGIVVASWDEALDLGRVHALGIVHEVDTAAGTVTMDWRRANFTLRPSPQGRAKWLNMKFFAFAERPATSYRLTEHFADAFSAGGASQPNQHQGAEPPTTARPEPAAQQSVLARRSPGLPSSGDRSPQRNRVAPDGTIVATAARGTFMGNRAYGNRWLVCDLDFERDLKEPRKYQKLFFLDEAVALAAGHRPCLTCRRHRYRAYVAAVQSAFPIEGADELNAHLENARNAPRARGPISSLPDGAFASFGTDNYWLMWQGALHRWTPHGYVDSIALTNIKDDEVFVVTPATSLAALRNGYEAKVHASVSVA